mgnify:CR=1 FL=1
MQFKVFAHLRRQFIQVLQHRMVDMFIQLEQSISMTCMAHIKLGESDALERAKGVAAARVQIGDGWLDLRWQPLPPRVIALMRLPRLGVAFAFEGVDEAQRQRFMKHFDLSTQRGGG